MEANGRFSRGRILRAAVGVGLVAAAVLMGVLLGLHVTADPPRPPSPVLTGDAAQRLALTSRYALTLQVRVQERPKGMAPRTLNLEAKNIAHVESSATNAFVLDVQPPPSYYTQAFPNNVGAWFVGDTVTYTINSGGPTGMPSVGYLTGGEATATVAVSGGGGSSIFTVVFTCKGPGIVLVTVGWPDGYGDNLRVIVAPWPFKKRIKKGGPFTDCGGPDRPDIPDSSATQPLGYGAGENGCTCQTPRPDAQAVNAGSVYTHSGEEHLSTTDLFVPGRGDIHFRLQRTHRSQADYYGMAGGNWQLSYDERLSPEGEIPPNELAGTAQQGDPLTVYHLNGYMREDAYEAEYVTETGETADGQTVEVRHYTGRYVRPSQAFRTLEREGPDRGWVLRDWNGFKRHFNKDGLLLSHEDRWGNKMTFQYSSDRGNLGLGDFTATDPFGRVYTFRRNDSLLIDTVTDFAGRTVKYTYDVYRDLVSVKGPAVTGTSTGNDNPGRTTVYTYLSYTGNPNLFHALNTVTEPHEVANGGPPRLTIHYASDGKVSSVDKGGTNDSGVPAGGTWSFTYESVGPADGFPPGSVTKTTVTDPSGNVTVRALDSRGRHLLVRAMTRGLRDGEPAFFQTLTLWNEDSLPLLVMDPIGNITEFGYDDNSLNVRSRRNLLSVSRRPDAARNGGDASALVTTFEYEPFFNQVTAITDARGNNAAYVPPTGPWDAERYTTRFYYDFNEGSAVPDGGIDSRSVTSTWGI